MADLSKIRQAIADAVNSLEGVTAWPMPPDMPNAPCAIVEPVDVSWDQQNATFGRGHEHWTMRIVVLIALASNTAAQVERDTYFGGIRDVKDAVEGWPTLHTGAAAQDVFVRTARRFDSWKYSDVAYLGVEIILDIRA
jgi:hypothetical protein